MSLFTHWAARMAPLIPLACFQLHVAAAGVAPAAGARQVVGVVQADGPAPRRPEPRAGRHAQPRRHLAGT